MSSRPRAERFDFGRLPDGCAVGAVRLSGGQNGGQTEAVVMAWGAGLQALRVPDRDGAMDDIALKQSAEFAEVIASYRSRIRHLFFGHVHRPIFGSYGKIPFSTLRGTNHQVWFELDADAPHLASHEPPAYAVVFVAPDQVTVHFHDYLDRRTLVKDGDGYRYAP